MIKVNDIVKLKVGIWCLGTVKRIGNKNAIVVKSEFIKDEDGKYFVIEHNMKVPLNQIVIVNGV